MFNHKSKRNVGYVIEAFGNRKYLNFSKLIGRTRRVNCMNNGLEKNLSKNEIISAIKRAEKKGFIMRVSDSTCRLYEIVRKC